MRGGLAAIRRVGETVFVADPAPAQRRNAWLGFAVVPVMALVVGVRAAALPITTTVWAEDGREFLGAAVRDGAIRPLLRGYAGYAHLVPRLIATIAAAARPADAALVLAVGACVMTALLGWFCVVASRGHVRTPLGRGAYALAIVLLPVAGYEVLGNLANLHWFLLVAAFWAVIWRPASTSGVVVACIVVVLAALSDPLTVVLLPLAGWRVLTLPAWRDRSVVIALALGLTVQFWVVAHTARPQGRVALSALPRLVEVRIVLGTLFGVHGSLRLAGGTGPGVVIAAGLVVLVLGVAWVLRGGDQRAFAAVATGTALTLFVTCLALRGGSRAVVSGVLSGGSRYTIAPQLLLLPVVIILLERVELRVVVPVALVVAALWATDFRVSNLRDEDLTWARGVATARTQCRFGARNAGIPTQPLTSDGQWQVVVPCSYLSR